MQSKLVQNSAKSLLVILWIVVTLGLGVWSAYGNIFYNLNELSADFFFEKRVSKKMQDRYLSPVEYLTLFNSKFEHPIPIDAILDEFYSDQSWSALAYDSSHFDPRKALDQKLLYFSLFDKILSKLTLLASQKESEVERKRLAVSIPPQLSFGIEVKDSIKLPQQAVEWIKEYKVRKVKQNDLSEMTDKIMLIISLGAFGSVIYLLRCFTQRDKEVGLSVYMFQPFLGAFLAFGLYVVSGLAHTAISTAGVVKMRYESLYLLGFAAGLLSEQTYQLIVNKLNVILNKLGGNTEGP